MIKLILEHDKDTNTHVCYLSNGIQRLEIANSSELEYQLLASRNTVALARARLKLESPPPDLEELFELQEALNRKCGIDTSNLSEEDQAKWIRNFSLALNQELSELIDSTPWKWWAKYQKFDKQNAKVEVVDILHFVISLAQVLGMSSSDLANAYKAKHKVNEQRQASGYTTKDSEDSRHI